MRGLSFFLRRESSSSSSSLVFFNAAAANLRVGGGGERGQTHVVDSEAAALHSSVEHSLSVGHVDVLGALVSAIGFGKRDRGRRVEEK